MAAALLAGSGKAAGGLHIYPWRLCTTTWLERSSILRLGMGGRSMANQWAVKSFRHKGVHAGGGMWARSPGAVYLVDLKLPGG